VNKSAGKARCAHDNRNVKCCQVVKDRVPAHDEARLSGGKVLCTYVP